MEMIGKEADPWSQRVVLRVHIQRNDGKGFRPVVSKEGWSLIRVVFHQRFHPKCPDALAVGRPQGFLPVAGQAWW